jgi:LmbE family N-acetylglucosaminyl deacetylase
MTCAFEILTALRQLPILDLDQAIAWPALVLSPHPDDESLGCGGLIAEASARQREIHITWLTDGSRSHPNSKAWPTPRLRALREQEGRDAAAALGVPASRLTFLRLPDGSAPHQGPSFAAAATSITELAKLHKIRTILTTWQYDPHPDHVSANLLASAVCARIGACLFAFPIWGWTLPEDADIPAPLPTGFRLDISQRLPAKRAAIAAHRSQTSPLITDDPDGHYLEPALLARFYTPYETFIASPPATNPAR